MATSIITRIIKGIATEMETQLSPPQLMVLTQWLSPAFPIGAFSYSHGLEQALAEATDLDVEGWLADCLRFGAGRTDAILIRAGFAGLGDDADALGRALAPSRERALESAEQGTAFCKILRQAFDIDLPDRIYPVALGEAAEQHGLPLEPVVTLYLHAFASNLTAAAQRLSPLGQTRAQQIVRRLGDLCEQVTQDTRGAELEDIGGAVWAADVASMRHETLGTRIFRT